MRRFPRLGGVVGAALAIAMTVAAAGCGGGESKPTTGPEIYKSYCSTCHGVDGQGGVGPALGDGVVAEKYPNIDDQIAVVMNGKGTMPAWRGRLTPQQIRRVVVYERTKLGQ